jgi:acetyl esterase/lipase
MDSAAAQPRPDLLRDTAVLTLPGMEKVKADTGLVFSESSGRILKFDLFHPLAPSPRAPLVVFVNGVGMDDPPLRRWGIYQSWARLVAATGMAAVVHDARRDAPRADIESLIAHLRSNAARYGIDPDDIAIWACSANLIHGSWYALNPANSHVKAAVFYYGNVDTTFLRTDLPVLVARAGLDGAMINGSLNAFVSRALARNVAVTLLNLPNARHAFDLVDHDESSRSAVRATLEFLRSNLTPEMQAARRERGEMLRTVDRHAAHDWEGTVAAAREWLRKEPEAGQAYSLLGDAHYQSRRYREAGEAYERAGGLRWMPALTLYNAACSWALAGESDRALQDLERALATGFITDRNSVAADPDFASLREDPRFRKLVEGR